MCRLFNCQKLLQCFKMSKVHTIPERICTTPTLQLDLYNSLNRSDRRSDDEVPLVNKKLLPFPLPPGGPPTTRAARFQSNKQLARQREIDAEIAANQTC